MLKELESILTEFAPGQVIPLKRCKRIAKMYKKMKKYFSFPKKKDLLLRGRKQFVNVFPATRDHGLRRNSL